MGMTTVLDVTMPTGVPFDIEDIAFPLRYTDFFLPNSEEATRLTGKTDEWSGAKCLGDLNPDCAVVITRGPGGPIARWRGQFIETLPFRIESVDESGAGDAFAAGLITGVLHDWGLESTLVFASAVGASSTRALGCFSSIFTFEEAISFVKSETISCCG
jgi:2-dehydro-3-deoxygluconokinase